MRVGLDGRTLIVTGGTQGVGAAIARLAAESGASGIVVAGRNAERGGAVAQSLAPYGCRGVFVEADLAEPDAPGRLVSAAVDAFGKVDGLVNAAADTHRAGLEHATIADWDSLFTVNARAPFFLMQAAVRDMKRRAEPGSIVNILSMNLYCGAPELAVYSATKGALGVLTKNAANAFLTDRIRVNGINVGWVATPAEHVMQSRTLGKGEEWLQRASAGMPLGRLLTIDEVAQLAVFLLSDMSGLMTGVLVDLEQIVVGALGHAAIAQ
ncbi:MAG: SDR family oxidoreductase [Rhizobiales bacterium]|nr:SDR family oxidoreductase [Hyphomicrobiales bacterium]